MNSSLSLRSPLKPISKNTIVENKEKQNANRLRY